MAHRVILFVPLLLNMSVKTDLYRIFRNLLQPNAAARQPAVGQLGLPAVHQLLAEYAVFISQGISHGGVSLCGQAVQETGGKPPKAPVAQTRIGFLLIEVIQFDIVFGQGLLETVFQPQVVEVVPQERPSKNSMQR